MTRADIDPEMQEMLSLLSTAIVPRHRRKAVVRTNYHAPYYTKSRYSRY